MRKIKKSKADKFIEDYLTVFNTYSIKNQLYGKIALHTLLGQIISHGICYKMGSRIIDPRIHMFLIKPQGTGKGAGFGFIVKLAIDLDLNFEQLTESTDAGLAGTIKYNQDTKQEEVIPGLLKTADIIGMEEASVILDYTSDFSKKNMTYMQITMNNLLDSSCQIDKKLGSNKITFKPHASFVLMSYRPDNLAEKVLKTGFFDRLVPIFEDVTLEDRLDVIQKMTEKINISVAETMKIKKMYKNIVKYLEDINNKYGSNAQLSSMRSIIMDENIHDLIISVIEEFAIKILDASPKARDKLEHFISRLFEILLKFAIHHCVLDGRTRLDVSDIAYARLTYKPIWQNLIISLESLLIISPHERARKHRMIRTAITEYDNQIKKGKYIKEKLWVRRLSMIPNLQSLWDNCSRETAHYNLKKLEKQDTDGKFKKVSKFEKDKFFESRDIGGFTYLKKIKDIK